MISFMFFSTLKSLGATPNAAAGSDSGNFRNIRSGADMHFVDQQALKLRQAIESWRVAKQRPVTILDRFPQ